MIRPRTRFAAAVALAAAAAIAAGGCGGSQTPPDTTATGTTTTSTPAPTRTGPPAVVLSGTVSSVVDGDTVKVVSRGFETTVRLVGIDTPETRRPGTAVQCFGPQATRETVRLLPVGRRVRLETDPSQDTRDRYGRLLAYVYTDGRSGPRGSVNYLLVASGHARVYVYRSTPFAYTGAFRQAEAAARARRAGLWGPPCDGDASRTAASGIQSARHVSMTPHRRPRSWDV